MCYSCWTCRVLGKKTFVYFRDMFIGGTATLLIGLVLIYVLQVIVMPIVKRIKDGLESVVNCFKRPDRCIANLAGGAAGAARDLGRRIGFGQETRRSRRHRRYQEFNQSVDIGAAVENIKKGFNMLRNVFSNLILYMFYGLLVASLFMASGVITFQPAIIVAVLGAILIPILINIRSLLTKVAKLIGKLPYVGQYFGPVADDYNVLAPWVMLLAVTTTMYMVPSVL